MKARTRIIVAALAGLAAGVPAHAQDARQDTPAQPRNDVVGLPQLSNFSLNGTVTHAAPAPAPARNPPSTPAVKPTQTSPPTKPTAARAESPPAPKAAPARTQVALNKQTPAPPDIGVDAPVGPKTAASAAQSGLPAPAPADAGASTGSGAFPILPWLVAALAAAAAAGWFLFLRQRPRQNYAAAGNFDLLEKPEQPRPEPPIRARSPRAPAQVAREAAPVPASAGLVSTRLRPWLEIEFEPDRAVVDDTRAAVAFRLSVLNSGSVPARDVLLEASLFNAGPMQDQQIQLFFDNPVARGDRIPLIPPMQRARVETAVFLAREQVRAIEVEGRSIFVPMIAFNALYRWGGNAGQSSASYLVGKQTSGDKLAPFRLDLGPRVFRGLGAREHELRIRR